MTGFTDTIREYERSCALVRGRITEINARMSGQSGLLPGETHKILERRRYLLYCELNQMERSIVEMLEYMDEDIPLRDIVNL